MLSLYEACSFTVLGPYFCKENHPTLGVTYGILQCALQLVYIFS